MDPWELKVPLPLAALPVASLGGAAIFGAQHALDADPGKKLREANRGVAIGSRTGAGAVTGSLLGNLLGQYLAKQTGAVSEETGKWLGRIGGGLLGGTGGYLSASRNPYMEQMLDRLDRLTPPANEKEAAYSGVASMGLGPMSTKPYAIGERPGGYQGIRPPADTISSGEEAWGSLLRYMPTARTDSQIPPGISLRNLGKLAAASINPIAKNPYSMNSRTAKAAPAPSASAALSGLQRREQELMKQMPKVPGAQRPMPSTRPKLTQYGPTGEDLLRQRKQDLLNNPNYVRTPEGHLTRRNWSGTTVQQGPNGRIRVVGPRRQPAPAPAPAPPQRQAAPPQRQAAPPIRPTPQPAAKLAPPQPAAPPAPVREAPPQFLTPNAEGNFDTEGPAKQAPAPPQPQPAAPPQPQPAAPQQPQAPAPRQSVEAPRPPVEAQRPVIPPPPAPQIQYPTGERRPGLFPFQYAPETVPQRPSLLGQLGRDLPEEPEPLDRFDSISPTAAPPRPTQLTPQHITDTYNPGSGQRPPTVAPQPITQDGQIWDTPAAAAATDKLWQEATQPPSVGAPPQFLTPNAEGNFDTEGPEQAPLLAPSPRPASLNEQLNRIPPLQLPAPVSPPEPPPDWKANPSWHMLESIQKGPAGYYRSLPSRKPEERASLEFAPALARAAEKELFDATRRLRGGDQSVFSTSPLHYYGPSEVPENASSMIQSSNPYLPFRRENYPGEISGNNISLPGDLGMLLQFLQQNPGWQDRYDSRYTKEGSLQPPAVNAASLFTPPNIPLAPSSTSMLPVNPLPTTEEEEPTEDAMRDADIKLGQLREQFPFAAGMLQYCQEQGLNKQASARILLRGAAVFPEEFEGVDREGLTKEADGKGKLLTGLSKIMDVTPTPGWRMIGDKPIAPRIPNSSNFQKMLGEFKFRPEPRHVAGSIIPGTPVPPAVKKIPANSPPMVPGSVPGPNEPGYMQGYREALQGPVPLPKAPAVTPPPKTMTAPAQQPAAPATPLPKATTTTPTTPTTPDTSGVTVRFGAKWNPQSGVPVATDPNANVFKGLPNRAYSLRPGSEAVTPAAQPGIWSRMLQSAPVQGTKNWWQSNPWTRRALVTAGPTAGAVGMWEAFNTTPAAVNRLTEGTFLNDYGFKTKVDEFENAAYAQVPMAHQLQNFEQNLQELAAAGQTYGREVEPALNAQINRLFDIQADRLVESNFARSKAEALQLLENQVGARPPAPEQPAPGQPAPGQPAPGQPAPEAQAAVNTSQQQLMDIAGRYQLDGSLDQQELTDAVTAHITNNAALKGQNPEEALATAQDLLTQMFQDQQVTPEEMAGLVKQHPELAALAEAAPQNDWAANMWKEVTSDPIKMFAALLGIPLALIGMGNLFSGDGGIGSILMMLLGLGGAAYGTGLLGNFGGGEAPPAAAPAAEAAATPAAEATPNVNAAPAEAPGVNAAAMLDISNMPWAKAWDRDETTGLSKDEVMEMVKAWSTGAQEAPTAQQLQQMAHTAPPQMKAEALAELQQPWNSIVFQAKVPKNKRNFILSLLQPQPGG